MIWRKLVLKELLKGTLFTLFVLLFLYILIDYATRISKQEDVSWLAACLYYLATLSRRLEILLPFALIVSVCRLLVVFYFHRSWIVTLTSGISRQKLMSPFLIFAAASTIFLYANNEWLLPPSMTLLENAQSTLFHHEPKESYKIPLQDGGVLFFRNYDAKSRVFSDTFLMPRWGEVIYSDFLHLKNQALVSQTHHLFQQTEGTWKEEKFYDPYTFLLKIEEDELHRLARPVEQLRLEELLQRKQFAASNALLRDADSLFWWRLSLPWLALIAVLVPLSYGILFTRGASLIIPSFLGCFLLLSIYLILKALATTTASGVLSGWVIGLMIVLLLSILAVRLRWSFSI